MGACVAPRPIRCVGRLSGLLLVMATLLGFPWSSLRLKALGGYGYLSEGCLDSDRI